MTRLVRHVGNNGEVHETPIMTTFHRHPPQPEEDIPIATTAKTSNVQIQPFEDFDVGLELPSLLSVFTLLRSSLTFMNHVSCILLATVTTTPVNKRVRKSPPHTTSVETTVTIKRPKTDKAGSRGHTRVSDFDDLTKSLVDETISIYQAQIAAVQPWPSIGRKLGICKPRLG